MDTAVIERPRVMKLNFTPLNYRKISPFQDLKILIADQQELKQAVAVLLKHGYAWSDGHQTQSELFYGAQHEHIYASFDANITFSVPFDEDHIVIKAENLKDFLKFKKQNVEK